MLINLLRASLFTPSPEGFWGLPLLLWGEPGIGKTHLIAALARAYGLPLERLSPGERGEGQFGVVPVPGADGFLHYPAPAWAQRLAECGILFVDELNTAPPGSIQAALLGLIQLRILGSYQFGKRTRTLGAANEVADAAGGWDTPPALNNRFGHLPVDGLDAPAWVSGFLNKFQSGDETDTAIDAAKEEARVLAALPLQDARARGLVAGFVQRRPDLLHKKPPKGSKIRAWASRRSIDYATAALACAPIHGLTESETDELMGAFVGTPWVSEFRTWSANADLPDIEAYLDGKADFTVDTRRLDRTLAMLSACAAFVAPKTAVNRKARGAVAWKLIGKVLDDAADIAIPAAIALVQANLVAHVVPEARPVLVRLDSVLLASGIRRPAGGA